MAQYLILALALTTTPLTAQPFNLASDEFPIGMYSVDSEGAMKQAREMGIRYVHTYGMGNDASPEGIADDIAYMDLAQTHELKVMVYLNGRKWVADHGLLEMHKIVLALKDHPALGFWLFYDEPAGKLTSAELLPFYWLIKYETPDVPVAIVEAWTKDWWKTTEVCDILQLDSYPVRDEPFPNAPLGNVTEFIGRAVALKSAPIMPVLQCMNWKVMPDYVKSKGIDPDDCRYPSADEVYYWSYSSLAQGTRGLFWWSYYRSIQGGYGWINSTFKEAMLEVREFVDLVAPAHEAEIFEFAPDEDVHIAIWDRPAGKHVVLANGQPIARKISRGTEGRLADGTKLTPWGHTRDAGATVADGRITVQAEPWETFVWQLEEPGE